MNSVDEVANRLTFIESPPPIVRGALAHFGIRLLGLFHRGSRPRWITYFLKPRSNNLRSAQMFEQRRSCLTGTKQRRNENLIKMLVTEILGQSPCLLMPEIGQRRIDNVQTIAHPFRLPVTNKDDLHRSRRYRAGVASPQGWYPDPYGRFDHRWFDGERWTGDVANDGVRRVDPISEIHSRSRRRRWPFIVILVIALIAIPGTILGRSVQRFAEPAENNVTTDSCELSNEIVSISISVDNVDVTPASFTVFVEVVGSPLNRVIRSLTFETSLLQPGERRLLHAAFPTTATAVECEVVGIGGPLPFGVDLGPIEPVRTNRT